MELGAVRLAVVERRVEGVTNREVADAPGLRDTFTLGDVRLYVLRELGFDGVDLPVQVGDEVRGARRCEENTCDNSKNLENVSR